MISIIVPTISRQESLTRLLSSIQKNTRVEHEIIIVDGEKENTKCYSQAMNIGIKKAKGDYLTIPGIANDIEVLEDWDTEMLKLLENNDIGAGVFTVFRPDFSVESYGGFILPERYNNDPFDYPDYGGYMLVKRDVVDKVGLMDENFTPIYCEDADYGLRIWEAGYKIAVCENAMLIHYHMQEKRNIPRPENRAYLLDKHKNNKRLRQ